MNGLSFHEEAEAALSGARLRFFYPHLGYDSFFTAGNSGYYLKGKEHNPEGKPCSSMGRTLRTMGIPRSSMGRTFGAMGIPRSSMGRTLRAMGKPCSLMGRTTRATGRPTGKKSKKKPSI